MSDATTDMSLQESCKAAMTHMSVEVKLLIDKANELEAENARMREELDAAKHDLSVFSSEFVATNTENTKLRELAGYMIRCMQKHHNCVDCLVNGEQCDISCIESDLWELGIEVEE